MTSRDDRSAARFRRERILLGSVLVLLAGASAFVLGGGPPQAGAIGTDRATPPAPTAEPAAGLPREVRSLKAKPRSLPRDVPVPILMYHVIGDPRPGAAMAELYVERSDFAGQVAWLAREGFTAVTLRAVWDHWQGRGRLPERPVVITFDDGTRSVALRALPELDRRGWPAVLNLDLSNLTPSWGIRPATVRRLLAVGWEVGSHSSTHADLTGLDADALEREVAGSRRAIRKLFGVTPDFFCYPSGRFDDRVVQAVADAGYLGATTTIDGPASPDDPYRLARVRVSRSDGVEGFAEQITGLETG